MCLSWVLFHEGWESDTIYKGVHRSIYDCTQMVLSLTKGRITFNIYPFPSHCSLLWEQSWGANVNEKEKNLRIGNDASECPLNCTTDGLRVWATAQALSFPPTNYFAS